MPIAFGNVENTDWKYVDSSVVATSVSVPIPACSAGDLIAIVGYIDVGTATFSTPTDFVVGFTGSNNEGGIGIFTKTVTGSEGWGGGSGTVTLSRSGGSDALIQAIALRITGHDSTTPYNTGAQSVASGGANWNSPTITTTADGSLLFFGGGSRDVAGTFDAGDEPDTTTLIKQWATSGSWLGLAYETQSTAGATGTRQWTNPTNAKRAFSFAIAPSSATGLTITGVTPTTFDDGVTGIVIAGSGFGATQGSSTLTIGSQAQTVTAWSDTSITFTSARGSNSMGAASLKLTRG
jgi:hypothetical protein